MMDLTKYFVQSVGFVIWNLLVKNSELFNERIALFLWDLLILQLFILYIIFILKIQMIRIELKMGKLIGDYSSKIWMRIIVEWRNVIYFQMTANCNKLDLIFKFKQHIQIFKLLQIKTWMMVMKNLHV